MRARPTWPPHTHPEEKGATKQRKIKRATLLPDQARGVRPGDAPGLLNAAWARILPLKRAAPATPAAICNRAHSRLQLTAERTALAVPAGRSEVGTAARVSERSCGQRSIQQQR